MTQFIKTYPENISPELCKKLIALFNEGHKKKLTNPGLTGKAVDKKRKDSTDLSSNVLTEPLKKKYGPHIEEFFNRLMVAQADYLETFPILKYPKTWAMGVYEFSLQRYYPGGQAYHAWHFENGYPAVMDRVITWMTYLNTVEEGGETEFEYQGIKMQPEEGKTLLWPAGYTHSHRGLPAPNETKYIITGWFRFAPQQ